MTGVYIYETQCRESGIIYFYFSDVTPEESNDELSDYEEALQLQDGETIWLVLAEDSDYIHSVCKSEQDAKSVASYENTRSFNDCSFNLGVEFYVRKIDVKLNKHYPYDQ